MKRGGWAVAAAVCLAGCHGGSDYSAFTCAPLAPGRYTFVLTYTGEETFDGGCPAVHTFDGQTVTVVLDEHGTVTVATPAQTLSCWATSDTSGPIVGLLVHCPIPATDNQLQIALSESCNDSGVGVGVADLVGLDDASFDDLNAACTESYSAR
jgi:hypothetical protein